MGLPETESSDAIPALWSERPRFYLDDASINAAEILSDLPIDFVDVAEEANLVWVRVDPDNWYNDLAPAQALNHIPCEAAMVRKAELARHLHRYGASQPPGRFSHADFFQPTYCLSDPDEAAKFAGQLPAEDDPDNLWILKPSNLSKGRGVKIVWQFGWLHKELRKYGEVTFRYQGEKLEYVIQRYIKNVLLLDGKKSELRMYWLIASLDPLLVLMYPEGTARMTSQDYKLGDFSNALIHITNTYQQKKHGADMAEAVLKWDFARLEDYVVSHNGARHGYLDGELRPRLRRILAYAVRATLESLRDTPPNGFFFGLYGADFILDDALTPWLTEIQKGPGLSHDDDVKQHVLPPMLRGATSIVLELMALKRQGRPFSELSSTHGFEWVIHGTEPG